ncbi:cysteine--tRNA ligase [Malassezia sp. CBS 17886]|nr:cysteine--tRNA ligase [Malassezia sp. CBS 17886]
MALHSARAAAGASAAAWQEPVPTERTPSLQVYNSLTRSKVPFVATHGRSVSWYNCGPTVYDASHMGHARNYVTQDFLRRIMRDYFGYGVNFVMNITDIDDKIIVRARQTYLLRQFRAQHDALSAALLTSVQGAWSAYFADTLVQFAPTAPPHEVETDPVAAARVRAGEGGWEQVVRLAQDDRWRAAAAATQPKFALWFAALQTSRDAQVAAAVALGAGDTSAAQAQALVDASQDVLMATLDRTQGHTVGDPAVFRELAAFWEAAFMDDMARLNVEPPATLTRVSEFVPEIVAFIERVIANGYAYVDDVSAESRNVWFATDAFDGGPCAAAGAHAYAKLAPWSKGNRELLEEGEGTLSTSTAATRGKRHAADFALWKSAKPGEPSWPSPWGTGRPGWHIECSVMASAVLGDEIDIHSGGVDLLFPHHDNELAQSEAFHGCAQWINYFLHTGHLHIEGLKMSKSLKNFISIDEALQRYSARQLRLAFLMQHWNARMDFRESAMVEVRSAETTFNNFFSGVAALRRAHAARGASFSDGKNRWGAAEKALTDQLAHAQNQFYAAMCDNFDTPRGIDALLQLVSRANVYERSAARADLNTGVLLAVADYVSRMLRMFGLGHGAVREGDIGWGSDAADATDAAARDDVLAPYLRVLSSFRDNVRQLAREKAVHTDLLQLADKLRDVDLVDLGVALEDQEDGRALAKLVPREQLLAAREEKERAAVEKAARKALAAETARKKRQEQLAKGTTSAQDMFRPPHYLAQDGLAFGAWDEQGIPTHDDKGATLAKKRRKNLEKEYERQVRLHAEYLAAREAGEVE